jgi:hypothetical protein
MEISLRTPSFAYNHGGYYAPGDPRECNNPGGTCEYCQLRIDEEEAIAGLRSLANPGCCDDRAEFMEPCPSCGDKKSYISHASKGLRTCNGCDDKFCTKCYHGSRYCCAYVYLPAPSVPISRQCSEEKWVMAEDHLRMFPGETATLADYTPGHVYRVVRVASGELVRQHIRDESLAHK